jgi:hypothetical protein
MMGSFESLAAIPYFTHAPFIVIRSGESVYIQYCIHVSRVVQRHDSTNWYKLVQTSTTRALVPLSISPVYNSDFYTCSYSTSSFTFLFLIANGGLEKRVGVLYSRTPGRVCLSNANDLRSARGTLGTSPLAWRHDTMGGQLAYLALTFKE